MGLFERLEDQLPPQPAVSNFDVHDNRVQEVFVFVNIASKDEVSEYRKSDEDNSNSDDKREVFKRRFLEGYEKRVDRLEVLEVLQRV